MHWEGLLRRCVPWVHAWSNTLCLVPYNLCSILHTGLKESMFVDHHVHPDVALPALLGRLDKETSAEVAIKVIDLEDV